MYHVIKSSSHVLVTTWNRFSWMRNRSVYTIEHKMIPPPLHCSVQCQIECPSSLNPSQRSHFLSRQDLLMASAQTRKSQSVAKDPSRDVRHVFRSSSSPDEEQVCFFSRIRLMYSICNVMKINFPSPGRYPNEPPDPFLHLHVGITSLSTSPSVPLSISLSMSISFMKA